MTITSLTLPSTENAVQTKINEIIDEINNSGSSVFRLVQVANNGTAGYKVFEEYDPQTNTYIGLWCEEWGETGTGTNQRDINFTNTFKDTNYNASMVWGVTSTFASAGVSVQNISLVNATKTGFSIRIGSMTIPMRWRVSGYLEETT